MSPLLTDAFPSGGFTVAFRVKAPATPIVATACSFTGSNASTRIRSSNPLNWEVTGSATLQNTPAFVGNEEQLDAIKKLLDKVEEIGLLSDSAGAGSDYYNDDSTLIIEKFTSMLESKTDELLDKIKFGNRVDTDLLNYSQG